MSKATAVANPNIAFVKYWGQIDDALNLPANPSVSMNLAALTTVTTVEFQPGLRVDRVMINDKPAMGEPLDRVVKHLDRVRSLVGTTAGAWVHSRNDFPTGTGLASSASAFAALSLAATQAAGLDLDERALSRLARLGSGSACRSVPSGFSLWDGQSDESSYARQIVGQRHWDLVDVIALVADQHKAVGSQKGHSYASTSPLHEARLAAVSGWIEPVLQGIQDRDLEAIGRCIEVDALAMHGVMMTSEPSLLYWAPATVSVLQAVRSWREERLGVYFTLDAGPNVHCICESADAKEVEKRLWNLAGVEGVLVSGVGGGVRSVARHLF